MSSVCIGSTISTQRKLEMTERYSLDESEAGKFGSVYHISEAARLLGFEMAKAKGFMIIKGFELLDQRSGKLIRITKFAFSTIRRRSE